MAKVAIVDFSGYGSSVPEALKAIGLPQVLAETKKVLIKPNLVTDSPFPVTTSAECCGAVVDFVGSCTDASVVIAEGTGDPSAGTMAIFERLGYTRLAADRKVDLLDLNTCPLIRLENPDCPRFPKFYMPEIAMDHFIISVPVLKAHSLSAYTGALKNMMGFAPPKHYAGSGGIWNKAEFHIDIHQAIIDINRYRKADVTLLDASVGLADYHLGGPACDPPVGRMVAGFDPVAVDRHAAAMLGLDWRTIGHLAEDAL